MATGRSYPGWGIAVLRIVVGAVFFMHGWQKLSGGFAQTAGFLAHFGFPFPMFWAVLLTLVEFVGGIALILGLFARWAAALIAIEMLVAFLRVHMKGGFFLPRGFEYVLTLFAASLAIALGGSGPASIDALRARRHGP